MDESYLQWLGIVPGLDAPKAGRIAARFPTYERLRAATRQELLAVEGLSREDVDAIVRMMPDAADRDASGELFLCTECGSFAGRGSTSCPHCGAEFEGVSESDLADNLDEFLEEEASPARICLTCGAAMREGATACPVCGRAYAVEELALLPGLAGGLEEGSPFCARCGAYLSPGGRECAICGTAVAGDALASAPAGRGAVKDFLSRWQRMAESGPSVPDADRLAEELDHFDRLLEADPTLERAWANRAKILEKLGRTHEAVESLAKASELNPAKDDTYRLEVQDILRGTADAPVHPPRWRQPVATAPRNAIDLTLMEALAHYDALLRADPGLVVAWRTKAEILERLGRSEESRQSAEKADLLDRADARSLRAAVAGLRSQGLRTSGPAGGGRTNGRVNGGRDGRTNGRVNGLSEGRVNGLTFGAGATNGLVNGNGFTNGRRGRHAPMRIPETPHWSRSVVGIAAVVALMVIVPVLASMLSPGPGLPASVIRIDGDFGDWAPFPAYVDAPGDQVQNPNVNLLATKVVAHERDLFVNVRVQGILFDANGPDGADSIFVFVDSDDDRGTGYPIGDLGADVAVEVYGWAAPGGTEYGVVSLGFDASASPSSNDWRRFIGRGSAEAAFGGQNLEVRMTLDHPSASRVLVYAADALGNRDPADGSIRPGRSALVVGLQTVAPDIVTGPTAFLRVSLAPIGGDVQVDALNLTRLGNSPDAVDLALFRDDGDGTLDAGDAPLGTAELSGPTAAIAVGANLTSPAVFWIRADWRTFTPTTTFGLSVSGIASNGSTSFRSPEIGLVYVGAAPAMLRVDGAFGDWSGRPYGQDLLGDVTNRTGAIQYDANVDLLATAVDLGTNLTGFVRVDGRIFGGQDLPTTRSRAAAGTLDSDLDGVPDWVEQPLGPALAHDFNNDNVTDDLSNFDVDADGLIDYPDGQDCWLNTTIPAWYPAPHGGQVVARYICPIGATPLEGVDVVYAYIDADNATATGLWSDVDGRRYGFDYAIVVIGRNGAVNASGLYAFAPSRANPWDRIGSIAVSLDAHRMEFAADASAMALTPGSRIVYYASDWRLGFDAALPDAAVARFPVAAQAATNAVINEVSPQPNPEWIEIANPLPAPISLSGWNLVVRRNGAWAVLFAFTTQVLGPFGSGTEYLRVQTAGGSLPNGNGRVALRQGTTIRDETRYPARVNNGQSWARFKDPLTGVPMDTNNNAADFYISALPSTEQGNDRHRPTIVLARTGSRTVAAPGDLITYTLYYNNTNTGTARTVWVNDTLPNGVSDASSSASFSSVAGSTYGWIFASVMPGPHSVTVTVQVTASAADGQVLRNVATLDYVDQIRRSMTGSIGWVNTTVSRPMITLVKVASPATARPGDLVTFTIYYNNTGSAAAGTVKIKDGLPAGVTYQSASLAPTWSDGRTFYWNFTNVAPGPHSLTFTARVNATFTGVALVNWAFLNYTTMGGYALVGSSASAIVAIPELSDMIFVALVPVLIIGLKIRASRRKKE